MATTTQKRAVTPRKYKTPLYERMRRQAIKPTSLWAKLSKTARAKLVKAGYDQWTWDNNCRETVTVNPHDLLCVGSSSSPVVIGSSSVSRSSYRRKLIVDDDAFRKAIINV